MRKSLIIKAALLASIASPGAAQSNEAEVSALRSEVANLREQLAALSAKIDAAAVAPKAPVDTPAAAPTVAEKKSGPEIKFKGAPEITAEGGWSFKPRGRLQFDVASVNTSAVVGTTALGTATRVRRAFLGVEGSLPGGFGYRAEADFAGSAVDLTDLYLTYKSGAATITVGQHKPFGGLEETSSDLFTSFLERAAYHGAFGFERRVGASVTYAGKQFLVQGGIFADNAADLNTSGNNSRSFDGRVVFMPRLGDTQLHLGASAHSRKFNDLTTSTRYRARPFTRTTETRFVDTRAFSATGESNYGVEAFVNHGRFHATGEGHWLTAKRPGLADPGFFGGYAEIGMFLTDDSLGYKGGSVDRTKPKSPLGKGGMGAFQVNARYDYLDLNDGVIVGGTQAAYGLSLIWTPTEYVRFMANYGHLEMQDSPILAGGSADYSADVVGLRGQIDF